MAGNKLRFITYLSPSLPVEIFETTMQYLEEVTGCETSLIYESRWSGPQKNRTNPFTNNDVDIGFMCASGYLSMLEDNNPHIELCNYSVLHQHNKNENRPVYFSELVVNAENKSTYKEFHDLRGHVFAYNEETSLSGCLVVLAELRKMGFNSSFFGNVLKSGSQLKSIEMVLNNTADVAAIDSYALYYYLKRNPQHEDKLAVLKSFGPLPIYPIIFNKRLPDDLKTKITEALRDVHKNPEWKEKLEELNISGFGGVDTSHYLKQKDLMDSVKSLPVVNAYY